MPTPTPAKPRTSGSRARGFGLLVAFVAAIGFAVHLLGGETPSATEPPPPAAAAEPRPAAPVAEEPREPPLGAAVPPSSSASDVRPSPPSLEELESQLAHDPNAVLGSLRQALPKGEREEQKLKLLEVQALVKNGKIGAARGRASDYFERWPNGPDTATLEALTGAHPRNDRGR